MTKILLTSSFAKELKSQRIANQQDVIDIIRKHNNGLPVLINLYSPRKGLTVLKGYIGRNRAQRLAILSDADKDTYVPFFIAKKSTHYGWNLSKYMEPYLSICISRSMQDIEIKQYKEVVI